jgi:hypothetical protein
MSDENALEIKNELKAIEGKIEELRLEQRDSNTRIDAYQKASTQVVNLAFTVIIAAAAVTILSPAVKAVADYFTR